MRHAASVCLALLALGACRGASAPLREPGALTTPPAAADSQAVAAQVGATFAAIARGDTADLRRRLSDGVRWVLGTRGAVVGKAQLLAAAGRTTPIVTLRYEVDSVRVWRAGAVATAEYRLTDHRTFGAHTNTFVARAVDVFLHEGGAWRLRQHVQSWIVRSPAAIALDTAAIRDFVGRYERGPGFIDDVHVEGGVLRATSSAETRLGLPGAHLVPVSDDTFSPDGIAPVIVFERDAKGRVVGYVQQQPDGVVARARRLPDQ